MHGVLKQLKSMKYDVNTAPTEITYFFPQTIKIPTISTALCCDSNPAADLSTLKPFCEEPLKAAKEMSDKVSLINCKLATTLV